MKMRIVKSLQFVINVDYNKIDIGKTLRKFQILIGGLIHIKMIQTMYTIY